MERRGAMIDVIMVLWVLMASILIVKGGDEVEAPIKDNGRFVYLDVDRHFDKRKKPWEVLLLSEKKEKAEMKQKFPDVKFDRHVVDAFKYVGKYWIFHKSMLKPERNDEPLPSINGCRSVAKSYQSNVSPNTVARDDKLAKLYNATSLRYKKPVSLKLVGEQAESCHILINWTNKTPKTARRSIRHPAGFTHEVLTVMVDKMLDAAEGLHRNEKWISTGYLYAEFFLPFFKQLKDESTFTLHYNYETRVTITLSVEIYEFPLLPLYANLINPYKKNAAYKALLTELQTNPNPNPHERGKWDPNLFDVPLQN